MRIELTLPYPPSGNRYYRRVAQRTLLSRAGRQYRRRVQGVCAASGVQPMAGPLAVNLDVHPPDRRRRDIDNVQKPLLDALQYGKAYFDDSQVKRLLTFMRSPLPDGKVLVCIEPLQ